MVRARLLLVAAVVAAFVPFSRASAAERADPALFVVADHGLSGAEVDRLVAATGASRAERVDVGRVDLVAGALAQPRSGSADAGETDAIGVDPSTFPEVAPAGTAEVAELWRRVGAGRPAVAHAVAAALGVTVGDAVSVGAAGRWRRLTVGALATTGLPGVGVLLDRASARASGLLRDGGLVLVVPGPVDPAVLAALARQAVPGVDARPLGLPAADQPSAGPTPEPTPTADSPSADPSMSASPSPWPSAPTHPAPEPTAPPAPPATVLPTTGSASWVRPAAGPITQGFGPHSPGGAHPGIDIGAPLGAPIRAAAAGTVLYAGPATGFGNEIVLQHPGGVQTVYGHMRVLEVRSGRVAAGQEIALVGAEGNATGPHLHFEVIVGGRRVDPTAWLRSHGVP